MRVIIKKKVIEIDACVESESTDGAYYFVSATQDEWVCSCPDHIHRKRDCKHIKAVQKEARYD